MSNSIFITALGISVIYALLKFAEMRFIIKENKPFKVIFRDTIFVYFSVIIGYFIIEQFAVKSKIFNEAPVFVDKPGF